MLNLDGLLDRLNARRRELIAETTHPMTMTAASALRHISEIDIAIAAIVAVVKKDADQACS